MQPALKENVPLFSNWKNYQEKQDAIAQENLIKQYGHLVEQMANRLSHSIPQHVISRDDLIGFGYIGLLEAIKKFDYTKGYQFETFGLWRIKGAMFDAIRKMDWVPRGLRDKAKQVNSAIRQLEQTLMRAPSEEELSKYLEMSLDDVHQSMSVLSISTLLSLDEPVQSADEEGKQVSRLDLLGEQQSRLEDHQLQKTEFQNIISSCIDKMPEKERLVITLLYYEELSQVEIAEVLNLTKGRISQIHSKAILRIRQALEEKGYSFDSFYS